MKIEQRTPTHFEITLDSGAASIDVFPNVTLVYADQPGRGRVPGTDRFPALARQLDGTVTVYDDRVPERAQHVARAALAAFLADRDTPARIAEARRFRVRELVERLDGHDQWAARKIAELEAFREEVAARRQAALDAADDPSQPLPTSDDLPHHPARRG